MAVPMRNATLSLLISWIAGCAASSAEPSVPDQEALEVALPGGESQLVARGDELEWRSCPPALPEDCEMTILEGDPRQPKLFTARFRSRGGFEMKPHWHPQNERVTILEGRVGVGFGDAIDRENVTWFGPGDYYVNAKEAPHFVIVDEAVLLQITGIGPWTVNYLE